MVPDLMSVQDYVRIPIALVGTGSAQNSQQQKEAEKGDHKHIHNVQSLLSMIHRSRGAVLPGISIFPQPQMLQHRGAEGCGSVSSTLCAKWL